MKRLMLVVGLVCLAIITSEAQITIPNSFTSDTTIRSADVNSNFSTLGNHALDRLSGGNISGNVTVDSGITIDGVDIGTQACITCTPTLSKLTLSSAASNSFAFAGGGSIAGALTAGSETVSNNLQVNGNAAINGTLGLGGALTVSGAATETVHNFLQYTETKTAPSISSNVLTVDLSLGTHFTVALNANISTLTISNPATTGKAAGFTIAFTADGSQRTITWPASVKWAGGAAPTPTATNGKVDLVQCLTYTAGTTWYCLNGGQSF